MEELRCFESKLGHFSLPVSEGLSPGDYWDVLYSENVLGCIGASSCFFPATTASIERFWSLAGYTQDGRERLTPQHSFEELFLKVNLP